MRKTIIVAISLLAAASLLTAQVRRGKGIVPDSSIEKPADLGVRMHTNYIVYAPEGFIQPAANPGGETPASLACVYDLVSNPISGCPIATATQVPTGGSGVIVIVDAFDYPGAASDLSTFSSEFGLSQANFSVQYATGRRPADACSSGWEGEEALDIEWAHAMAPNAQIVLMEASSNSNSALYAAVTAANSYIASHGGRGEVSMSWGGGENSSETGSDHFFTQSGVVYFASSGDSPDLSELVAECCLSGRNAGKSQRRKLYKPDCLEQRRRRQQQIRSPAFFPKWSLRCGRHETRYARYLLRLQWRLARRSL